MRLVRFKVTNFRSVNDSGWIEAAALASRKDGGLAAGRMSAWVAGMAVSIPEASGHQFNGSAFQRVVESLEGIVVQTGAALRQQVDGVRDLVKDALVKFVYFSNYGNLNS